jgi:hypothetical protein
MFPELAQQKDTIPPPPDRSKMNFRELKIFDRLGNIFAAFKHDGWEHELNDYYLESVQICTQMCELFPRVGAMKDITLKMERILACLYGIKWNRNLCEAASTFMMKVLHMVALLLAKEFRYAGEKIKELNAMYVILEPIVERTLRRIDAKYMALMQQLQAQMLPRAPSVVVEQKQQKKQQRPQQQSLRIQPQQRHQSLQKVQLPQKPKPVPQHVKIQQQDEFYKALSGMEHDQRYSSDLVHSRAVHNIPILQGQRMLQQAIISPILNKIRKQKYNLVVLVDYARDLRRAAVSLYGG